MTTTTNDQETAKLPPRELDSLVAPIALYSDPLLAQTLAASTYPLEVIQLQQWMDQEQELERQSAGRRGGKAAVGPKRPGTGRCIRTSFSAWQAIFSGRAILGNAFLAQQSDVMDAVQRMRAKAQGTGNLKTSAQQVVETQTVPSGKQVIKFEQANPDVVYVPSYDPTVVYGPPPPAYPYYPYTYPGYVPGTALMWGSGNCAGCCAHGALGAATGAIAIGTVATLRSITIIITIRTTISTATSTARDKVIGSTIRNTAEMPRMATEIRPINLADVAPVVRVALVVPEDPVAPVVRVALVVPEDPVARVALVVPEDPVARVALVVPEDPVVPVALVVPENPVERVALVVPEDPVVPVRVALVVSENPAVPRWRCWSGSSTRWR